MKEIQHMIDQGNLQGALETLLPKYEKDKNNVDYNYYLGLIATKQDRFDEALDYLTEAEKLAPEDARIQEILGEALGLKAQNAGMVKGAMLMPKIKKAFQKALELDPKSIRAREGLFMFYLFIPGVAGGDEKKAVEIAEELKSLHEGHGYLASALIDAKHNKMENAAESFKLAAEKAPEDSEVQLKVGRFFLQNKQFDQAQKAFEIVVKNKPFDPAGYDALGCIHNETEKYEQAIGCFTKAIDKNSAFFPARLNRAKANIATGKTEEAKTDLEHILQNHSKSPISAKAKELLAKL